MMSQKQSDNNLRFKSDFVTIDFDMNLGLGLRGMKTAGEYIGLIYSIT